MQKFSSAAPLENSNLFLRHKNITENIHYTHEENQMHSQRKKEIGCWKSREWGGGGGGREKRERSEGREKDNILS